MLNTFSIAYQVRVTLPHFSLSLAAAGLIYGCADLPFSKDANVNHLTESIRGLFVTEVEFLVPPEASRASHYRTLAVVGHSGPGADVVAQSIESALVSIKVNERPFYKSVTRGPITVGMEDARQIAPAARSLNAEAAVASSVTSFTVVDHQVNEKRSVCDDAKSNKVLSVCKKSHDVGMSCVQRVATVAATVRLIDATSAETIYSQPLSATTNAKRCADEQPVLPEQSRMLSQAASELASKVTKAIAPRVEQRQLTLMTSTEGLVAPASKTQFAGAVKWAEQKRLDRACELFEQIYDTEKESLPLYFNLGFCYESQADIAKAYEFYKRADAMSKEPNKLISQRLVATERLLKAGTLVAANVSDTTTGRAAAEVPAGTKPKAAELRTQKRVALVIGNGKYPTRSLPNPVNDARAMETELRRLGFEVIGVTDGDDIKIRSALDAFKEKASQADVGLFFYAGHGMYVKGENYLIPVNTNMRIEQEFLKTAVPLSLIFGALEGASPSVKIAFIDACRELPSWDRAARGGVDQVRTPTGSFVAFATEPGKTAADGAGSNGVFTSNLVKQLRMPNRRLQDIVEEASSGVQKDSRGEQVPWVSSSLVGDFYFAVTE